MADFEDLIQEVLLNVEGYLGDQAVYGTISGSVGSGATSFTISGGTYPDGSGFTTGLMEIADELVYVENFNRGTGVASGVLRGWRGTTAAAYSGGEIVRNNPRFPRIAVKRAINDTIRNLYPDVPAIATTEFTLTAGTIRYDLPTAARNVLSVRYQLPGQSGVWHESSQWRFDPQPGGEVAGNRSIDIVDGVAGKTARVVYVKEPSELSGLSDVYSTVTGLEDFTRDLVTAGATARLLSPVELAKISGTSASQQLLNQQAPVGAGADQAKFWLALYQQRLVECQRRVRELYPARKHLSYW